MSDDGRYPVSERIPRWLQRILTNLWYHPGRLIWLLNVVFTTPLVIAAILWMLSMGWHDEPAAHRLPARPHRAARRWVRA